MDGQNGPPRLYDEFASWWTLLSPPFEYEEEAAFYEQQLRAACVGQARTLLELGSGGAALFAPDFVRENFKATTSHGGYDGDGRALRYLEWTRDPDPADNSYIVDYAYLLRDGERVRVEHDRHEEGLFGRADWLHVLAEAGFEAVAMPCDGFDTGGIDLEVFVGKKN